MKIISLFSGAGGLDLGLTQAGNTVIWANDIDKDAVATYKENIGDHIVCDDIKNIDISTLPDADVVVGGFPCQGFSQANRLRTLEDDRNQLYRFFYNTIKIKQPKYFIAENVKGILSLGKGEAILEYPHLLKRLPSPWRALRDFRSLKEFCSVFSSIHFESHPESSSNSICESPFRSLAQFRPLHLP